MPPRAVCGVIGILNCTPDSFSDGGALDASGTHAARRAAVAAAQAMLAAGASWIDVGGESTRPGAAAVSAAIEIERVVPVIAALRAAGVPAVISCDTAKASVAAAALAAGADAINDISAGADPGMLPCVAAAGARLILMHMQGTPRTMQRAPSYADVVAEVGGFLAARVAAACAAGIAADRIYADPGIGFGKTLDHNLALLRALPALRQRAGAPLVLGISRKSFLAAAIARPDLPPAQRDGLSSVVHAYAAPHCAYLRVHAVAPAIAVLRDAAVGGGPVLEDADGARLHALLRGGHAPHRLAGAA